MSWILTVDRTAIPNFFANAAANADKGKEKDKPEEKKDAPAASKSALLEHGGTKVILTVLD